MNTKTTRAFSALAFCVIGAGLVVTYEAAPAVAAPGGGPGQAACTALNGSYQVQYGNPGMAIDWTCSYSPAHGSDTPDMSLAVACSGTGTYAASPAGVLFTCNVLDGPGPGYPG